MKPFLAIGNNAHLIWLPYGIFSTIACTLWVIPAWELMRRLTFTGLSAKIGVLLLATTGFALFNSTYVWPKMLSAYFGLMACEKAGLWDGVRNWRQAFEAGVLVALAMLSHGGVAFGFVGFMAVLFGRPLLPRVGYCAMMAFAYLAVTSPWSYWQKHEDPPGNVLLKDALAGTIRPADESKSLMDCVREKYSQLTFETWLGQKKSLFPSMYNYQIGEVVESRHSGFFDRLRSYDAISLAGMVGVGHLGWLFLLFPPGVVIKMRFAGFVSHSLWQASPSILSQPSFFQLSRTTVISR